MLEELQELLCFRHAESKSNARRKKLTKSEKFRKLEELFWLPNRTSAETDAMQEMARDLRHNPALDEADHTISLSGEGAIEAINTGYALYRRMFEKHSVFKDGFINSPDVIFCSPYARTSETLKIIQNYCPPLQEIEVIYDDRLREQNVGVIDGYGDYFIFFALHPDQEMLFKRKGLYYYKFPNGEDVPDVRLRIKGWLHEVRQKYAGKRVMVISHGNVLLCIRCELEKNWLSEEWLNLNKNAFISNCSATLYAQENTRLRVVFWNQILFS
jgi:broad specificity phosphatase PhoE